MRAKIYAIPESFSLVPEIPLQSGFHHLLIDLSSVTVRIFPGQYSDRFPLTPPALRLSEHAPAPSPHSRVATVPVRGAHSLAVNAHSQVATAPVRGAHSLAGITL